MAYRAELVFRIVPAVILDAILNKNIGINAGLEFVFQLFHFSNVLLEIF